MKLDKKHLFTLRRRLLSSKKRKLKIQKKIALKKISRVLLISTPVTSLMTLIAVQMQWDKALAPVPMNMIFLQKLT